MATSDPSSESISVDWQEVQTQLWLERPTKLRAEFTRGQDVFTADQIKTMNNEELAHHVLNLRKAQGKTTPVTCLVHGFEPVPFTPNPSYASTLAKWSKTYVKPTSSSHLVDSNPTSPSLAMFLSREDTVFDVHGTSSSEPSTPKGSSQSMTEGIVSEELLKKDELSLGPEVKETEEQVALDSATMASKDREKELVRVQTDPILVAAASVDAPQTVQPVAAAAPSSGLDPMLLFTQMMALMDRQRREEKEAAVALEQRLERQRKEEKDADGTTIGKTEKRRKRSSFST